jgi:hypothetical protein
MDATRGHYDKWNNSGSERQRQHIISYMWEMDKIQIQATVWKTVFIKEKSVIRKGGVKKEVKKVNMGGIFSIQEWI